MARGRETDRFVHDALTLGRAREDIRAVLLEAGWPRREVERALAAYAETPFVPPVPRPRPAATPRDAFLYALTFVALAIVVLNVVWLAFEIIDLRLSPDPRGTVWSRVAGQLAALAVFLPVFVWMDLRTRREDRNNPVRKGFAYAGLFVATMVLLVDLVATLDFAFRGGLGLEVGLRAGVVAVVAVAVFAYFRGDLARDADRPARGARR